MATSLHTETQKGKVDKNSDGGSKIFIKGFEKKK